MATPSAGSNLSTFAIGIYINNFKSKMALFPIILLTLDVPTFDYLELCVGSLCFL